MNLEDTVLANMCTLEPAALDNCIKHTYMFDAMIVCTQIVEGEEEPL